MIDSDMPALISAFSEMRWLFDAVTCGGVIKDASGTWSVSGDQPLPCRSGSAAPGMYRGVSVIGKRMLNWPSS